MKHIGNLTFSPGAKHSKKRIGRGQGSGHGGTSTRGHKGQKARSGATVGRGFEGGQMPIARRLPKFGFTNANFKTTYSIINLDKLQKFIDEGRFDSLDISYKMLKEKGIIKTNKPLKILGNGEINSAINISGAMVTQSAKEKIEKVGGKVEING